MAELFSIISGIFISAGLFALYQVYQYGVRMNRRARERDEKQDAVAEEYRQVQAADLIAHRQETVDLMFRIVETQEASMRILSEINLHALKIQGITVDGEGSVTRLVSSVNALTEVMSKTAPSLEKIGDDAFLIARGARDIGDGVTALRAVVFGGKRAEDFPMTMHDDERVDRAEAEYDIGQLMMDHGLSRAEATKRVKDNYAGRRMG